MGVVMRASETLIDGDPERYEQRYSLMIGHVNAGRFVRRPISLEPPEGTVCFVDDGPRAGIIPRFTAALFKDGAWRQVKWTPTHWTMLDD